MKRSNILYILIFLAIISVNIVAASEITFDVPTDFEIKSTNSTCANLVYTPDSRITITIVDDIQLSSDDIIDNLMDTFDTMVEETNEREINGITVSENVLDIPDGTNSKFYVYNFEKEGHTYSLTIAVTDSSIWDVEDTSNPVNVIISSLTLSSDNGSSKVNIHERSYYDIIHIGV